MHISCKQKLLNFSFHSESSQDEGLPDAALADYPLSARLNRGGQIRFSANLVRPNLFYQQDDDYYNTVGVTHPELDVPHDSTTKDVPKKSNQTSQDENITLKTGERGKVHEEYVFQEKKNTNREGCNEEIKQQKNEAEQSSPININNYFSITSSKSSHLLHLDLEQSQSQSQKMSQKQPKAQVLVQDQQQQTKKLSLLPHQLAKVSFQEIALTHNPFENMRVFTDKRIQIGKILRLSLCRNQSGLNFLWPEYQVCHQSGPPMLHAKKMLGNATSNYYITIKKEVNQIFDPYFVAKLRGNFSGSTYQIFSKGANPKSGEINKKVRSLEATVKFKSKIEENQPRQFQVYALAEDTKYYELDGIKLGEEQGLDLLYKNPKNAGKIVKFQNRKPVYSPVFDGYILNFGGRVPKASVKNFILQDAITNRQVLMLGKSDQDQFRVDVSWPMKPYIAYCICIANFDSRFVSD